MSQKSTVLLLFEDPDADAPGVDPEVAFVEVVRSPVGVRFYRLRRNLDKVKFGYFAK